MGEEKLIGISEKFVSLCVKEFLEKVGEKVLKREDKIFELLKSVIYVCELLNYKQSFEWLISTVPTILKNSGTASYLNSSFSPNNFQTMNSPQTNANVLLMLQIINAFTLVLFH